MRKGYLLLFQTAYYYKFHVLFGVIVKIERFILNYCPSKRCGYDLRSGKNVCMVIFVLNLSFLELVVKFEFNINDKVCIRIFFLITLIWMKNKVYDLE